MVGIKPINVTFASTAYGPLWAPAVDSWLRVVGVTSRALAVTLRGKVGGVGITDRNYTHVAQNTLVEEFLADPASTHLYFTEMDMILPDDAILKLLALDKDIASGLYFLRNGDGQPCLYQKAMISRDNPYPFSPVRLFPTDRPFKAGCPGLGCVLFKRRVFETLKFPWFDLKAGPKGYGSDIFFFTHVQEAGIEVWVDPSVRCGQIDYTVIGFEAYNEKLKKDPTWAAKGMILGGG